MCPPDFGNFINKVKTATKQTADYAATKAKIGKLKINTMTLNTEKARHLQTIGLRAYNLHQEKNGIDGTVLKERIRDEISQIERIESKIKEIESEIAGLEASTQHVEVTDVTDNDKGSSGKS
jgi:hypothetical protein